MIGLLVLALAAYAHAASLDMCKVGSWSEWSECKASRHCPAVPHPIGTTSIPATEEWDSGRDAMTNIMKAKAKTWERNRQCIKEGTCPEQLWQPIEGAYQCTGGIAGDIPCLNVHQQSYVNFARLGFPQAGVNGNDVWGWTDRSGNGDEYAIMGLTHGTSIVRITDPANPVPVGYINTRTVASSWRDIKVIGDYAFIVSEARDHGLQVFDLKRVRGITSLQEFQPDATNSDFGNAHNIVSNEELGLVYVVGATSSAGYPRVCSGGLLILDVSTPGNPQFLGCYGTDGYVHDAQCVVYHGPDTTYTGREICFCYNEDTLSIVDVTNKANMQLLSKKLYPGTAYTHQGWITDDHITVLLDDEQDEMNNPASGQFTKTYVWDVSNLDDPLLMSVFESPERSIDHNQYIIGEYTYQANYESGLRILRINPDFTLTQVGYFDVYPSGTTANFNGAWSVFPYYGSGNVAISSINHGLFIARPDMAAIDGFARNGDVYAEQTRNRSILSTIAGATCPVLLETKVCYAPVLC